MRPRSARRSSSEGWGARGAAEDRLKTTESVLAGVGDILSQARVLAVQGASTQGADSRAAIADNLEGLFQDLLGLANTRDGVSYVFSGYATETARVEFAPTVTMDDRSARLHAGGRLRRHRRRDPGRDRAQRLRHRGLAG